METYNEILTRMQDKFLELAGFSPDNASDIGIRLKVLASEIFSAGTHMEWLKNQMFAQTATGVQLDYHATARGLQRKSASKSNGSLVFSRGTVLDYDVEIPLGTLCSTADVAAVRFETTQNAVLKAGNVSVEVPAVAVDGSRISNVGINTITVLITPPAGIGSVKNTVAFTGGTDAETDIELRKRILESYSNISNGTNCAFYEQMALKYDGVHSASVVPLGRGPGTVDIYVAAKGGPTSDELIDKIQRDISALREINVDVLVKPAETFIVNVSAYIKVKPGYVFEEVRQACIDAITEYFLLLGIGERYLLMSVGDAIYHVDGVENYKFSSSGNIDVTPASGHLVTNDNITIEEGSYL